MKRLRLLSAVATRSFYRLSHCLLNLAREIEKVVWALKENTSGFILDPHGPVSRLHALIVFFIPIFIGIYSISQPIDCSLNGALSF